MITIISLFQSFNVILIYPGAMRLASLGACPWLPYFAPLALQRKILAFEAKPCYREGRSFLQGVSTMSIESRVNSFVLSTLNDLEGKRQNRMRLLAVVIGIGITIVMWFVHLSYPHFFYLLLTSRREIKFLAALVMVPPFATAFSLGYLLYPQANEPVGNDSGPMSGYFYRRSADRKWWIAIVAGIVAALNFLLMLITADEL